MKLLLFVLCGLLFGFCAVAGARQADLWDPDRPEPTVVLKESQAVAQAIKKIPEKIKQVINRNDNADLEEMDSNEIERKGIDDTNAANRQRFDAMPSLEESRNMRTLVIWTLVLAILTGFFALVVQIKRRLNPPS